MLMVPQEDPWLLIIYFVAFTVTVMGANNTFDFWHQAEQKRAHSFLTASGDLVSPSSDDSLPAQFLCPTLFWKPVSFSCSSTRWHSSNSSANWESVLQPNPLSFPAITYIRASWSTQPFWRWRDVTWEAASLPSIHFHIVIVQPHFIGLCMALPPQGKAGQLRRPLYDDKSL